MTVRPDYERSTGNLRKPLVFVGFLYDGIPAATHRQPGGNPPATRRQPPRERQLGPSGRPTQQEPFARRSREKEKQAKEKHKDSARIRFGFMNPGRVFSLGH